jgi:AhpD family alkylhydroperoxidase
MTSRIDFYRTSPKGVQAMMAFQTYVNATGIEHSLQHLVKLRASQINHCAFCIDMHTKDARAAGETEQRLHLVSAWREAPCYSERERAALEWTEALTMLTEGFVPDQVFDSVRQHFTEEELVNLSLVIVAVNGWNRLKVAFRGEVGSYQPRANTHAAGELQQRAAS